MEKVATLDTEKKLTRIGNYSMTGKTLGKGHFAHVLEGYHMLLKVKAAIKIINTQDVTDVYVKKNLKRETKIISKISHPNIVYLFETIETKRHYYIITELCSGGDLCNFVKSQIYGKLSERQARFFARQLVLAVGHLHSRGIIHRDLKMENILLDNSKQRVKIVDFGLSNFYNQQDPLKTHCGSPEYAAPELYVSGKRYGPEVDIWSLGIIFYGMLVGKLPFQTWHKSGLTQSEKRKHLMTETKIGLTLKHQKYLMDVSYIFRNLIYQMLKPNSCERISMHELQTNVWIADTPYLKVMEEYPYEDRLWKRNIISKIADCMHISYNEAFEKITDTPYGPLGGIYNMEKFVHLNKKIGIGNIREIKTTDKNLNKPNKDITVVTSKLTTGINRKNSKIMISFPSKTRIRIGTKRPLKNSKTILTEELPNKNIKDCKNILKSNELFTNSRKYDETKKEKVPQQFINQDVHYNLVRKSQSITTKKSTAFNPLLPLKSLQLDAPVPFIKASEFVPTLIKSTQNSRPLPTIKSTEVAEPLKSKPKKILKETFAFSLHSRCTDTDNKKVSIHNINNANNKIKPYFKSTKDHNNEIEKKNIYSNQQKCNKLESIYLNKSIKLNSNAKNNIELSSNNNNNANYENLNKINLKNKNEGILKYLFPFKSKELNSTEIHKNNSTLSVVKKSSGLTLMRNSINSKLNLSVPKKSSGGTLMRKSINSNLKSNEFEINDIDKNKNKKLKKR